MCVRLSRFLFVADFCNFMPQSDMELTLKIGEKKECMKTTAAANSPNMWVLIFLLFFIKKIEKLSLDGCPMIERTRQTPHSIDSRCNRDKIADKSFSGKLERNLFALSFDANIPGFLSAMLTRRRSARQALLNNSLITSNEVLED